VNPINSPAGIQPALPVLRVAAITAAVLLLASCGGGGGGGDAQTSIASGAVANIASSGNSGSGTSGLLVTAPAGADGWTQCAAEGEVCTVPGARQVRYGANGSYGYKSATGSIACSNDVFGDPVWGVVKSCSYADTSTTSTPTAPVVTSPAPTAPVVTAPVWTRCSGEDGTCSFTGTHQVRYGANGVYATKSATGAIACNNNVFGDPIWGVVKSCEYQN
jgi:hypothetical protein